MTDLNKDRTGKPAGQSSGQGGYSSGAGSHSVSERASEAANQATGYASRAASALASEAQEKAKGMLHQQMQAGADYVRMMSDTAHTAARELEGKAPELARWMHDAAGRVERFADDMRHRSINDVFSQATTFARNNPRVFFGGAVALGFVLSRFAKSSAQQSGSHDYRSPQASLSKGASGVAATGGGPGAYAGVSPTSSESASASVTKDPAPARTPGGSTYAR